MKTQIIMPTAGLGVRLGSDRPKPFINLEGQPLFIYALKVFDQCPLVDSVIMPVHPDYMEDFHDLLEDHEIKKVKHVIPGGETRADSVGNGLAVADEDTELIAVHDAARPLISLELVTQSIELAMKERAVVVAVPVKPTIKKVNFDTMTVEETVDRSKLWEIQTPQVFAKNLLIKAHESPEKHKATDDAYLVEQLGVPVKILMGDYKNIKITTAEDLLLAQTLVSESARVGS